MCGIIGIFGNDNVSQKDILNRAKSALERIKHRGSIYFELKEIDGNVIGANRLPIVDRANAIQPLSNEDESVFCVLNGEIFNYKNLREHLEKKGHIFRTNSDTEVLVHLYEEYGTDMLRFIDSDNLTLDKNILHKLTKSARRHYRIDGELEGAVKYYLMRKIESRFIEQEFPGNIFITFNPPEHLDLLPKNMPILFLKSNRKGSAPPWLPDVSYKS